MRSVRRQDDPVARAARSIALRVSATTALVVLVAVFGAGLVFDRQQTAEMSGRVESASHSADDVVDAPPGVWLVQLPTGGGTPEATAGTPPAVVDGALAAASQSGRTLVEADGREWPAWVATRGGHTFVAVYDVRLHDAEEGRLVTSTAVAGIIGVLLAAVTGLLAGRRAVRPLADALDLQRQFVADASHELRTPLAVISIRAQMLRRHLPSLPEGEDDPRRAEVDQLIEDTKAMGEVVSDLLLSAQLEHDEVGSSPVDVDALATAVVTSLEVYAAESGVRLERASSPGGRPMVVSGVSSSLRRAVLALVDNAISHSHDGDVVEVRVEHSGTEVRVAVVDHGAGVAAGDIDKLTRRFARGRSDGASRRVGLGLALVTQIVRSHGGGLEVGKTPGGGATFTVVLPAIDA